MLIGVPRETQPGENRTAMIPANVQKLVKAGAEVLVESGLGSGAGYADADYAKAGAQLTGDRAALLGGAELVLRLHRPPEDEIARLRRGAIHVSFLDPFNEARLIEAFVAAGVSAISMEMIPRTTRSQKMDALSSQASLGGYVSVLLAATRLPRILPMMMTPAGTLKPANVFVIGAGVAGLQAIATAKRLGAKVIAFDTRPVVAEQVQSLGAKFLEIDLGETGQTSGGYAVQLTPEQLEKQKQGQARQIADSDVVITTAQVFGRRPPLLVTKDMLAGMKPGSVIVDMAAETGGNVEGSVAGQTVDIGGVTVIGNGNWANYVARDASQMYSANLYNLIETFWNRDEKRMALNFEDDIVQGCVITHDGAIVNETIRNLSR